MKVTLNWLKELVDFGGSPADLAERLTMLGLEVEGVEARPADFAGVVVGHVLSTGHAGTAPAGASPRSVWAPWGLFLVFLFGPCEPLIPLLIYPAATLSPLAVGAVAMAFAAATVGTMVAMVLILRAGVGLVRTPRLERYGHALAGLAVAGCGLLVAAGL